jgi:hypothetical protein
MLEQFRTTAESVVPAVIVLVVVLRGLIVVVVQAKLAMMRAADKREAIRQALRGRTRVERDQGRLVLAILERSASPNIDEESSADP